MSGTSAATATAAEPATVATQPEHSNDVFTVEEKKYFDMLRARLEDLRGDDIADDFLADDSVMWRFYTSHADGECPGPLDKVESVLDAAEAMFRTTVAWRHEINIDDMWRRWRSTKDPSKRQFFERLGSYAFYGQGHVAEDMRSQSGGPLIFERLGKCDLNGIVADEEMTKSVIEAYTMYVTFCYFCFLKHS